MTAQLWYISGLLAASIGIFYWLAHMIRQEFREDARSVE
jgi:hypothetical protein